MTLFPDAWYAAGEERERWRQGFRPDDAVAIKGRFWQGFELVNIGINCFCSRKTQFCGKRVKGQCPLREFEGRALKVFRLFQR